MINEDNGSDIEAQGSSPLLMNSVNSMLILRRLALILRSTYKFIEAGARIPSLSRVSSSSLSSTTTFYTPLPSFKLKHGDAEGGEDEIQVVEIVADDNTVQSNNDHIDIDQSTHQQCLQISEEIVKEKKLDWSDIHDVDKGIHVGDNSGHHMLIFTGYMIRQLVCKEPTIFLLAIAAILSFAFGIKEEGVQNVSTLCIENVGWLKEQKLEVSQFFLDKKNVTKIPPDVCSVLFDGICVSTLTSQTTDQRMEEPILCWAKKNMGMQRDTLDQQFIIVKDNDSEMNPFEVPCGVVIDYYDMKGEMQDLDDETKSEFAQANNNNVNVVAFACKRTQVVELDENGLTFIGMFVLEDTFNLDNMRQAIVNLKEGGVKMIFASEEDVEVLRTIGDETGLHNSHEALVVRGEEATKENVEKICIMGNSSPAHKRFLIEQLKKRGEVVAVVGEQTSESNVVLEAAHFGLPVVTNRPKTMTYVINSIKGGRIVCENLRQFIQVEVILAISSLSINFILVIVDGDAPLTFIQLVWVNLLVTFIGGPALLITQQATRELSDELSVGLLAF
ncbi:hypothetical protein MTR67_010549 [Solanum verrucosum]|uniref:Cation-transporting P-type ATPase C-terminal domain-containing protein n=1 Tax=Solanum verrucosum TaxID=315347 RepID=A0AAF0QC17_SOLVR|nr:hypothetical protein MTR67_010549 [Solanum verrucosum]